MPGTWNATIPTGGNSLTDSASLNSQYTQGDFAWILFCGAIVWLEIPGIGLSIRFLTLKISFFYAGLSRRKSALAAIWQSCMCISIISFQVYFIVSKFIR